MVQALSQSEIDRLAAEGRRELERERAARPPAFANVENALHMAEPETLEYRGRRFRVPPVSAIGGLRLFSALERLHQAANEDAPPPVLFAAYRGVLEEMRRLARPPGWRGWLWDLRPNPFRRATPAEIRELANFFKRYPTRSRVRYRWQQDRKRRRRR